MTTNHNDWFVGVVENIVVEAPLVKSFFFRVPRPLIHLAGQQYELRLTAENGYHAARLYSAAMSNDDETLLQLTIMDVPGGEVSPYVTRVLKVGDEVELRGPFGKFFVWLPSNKRPVLLIGGGSGVVPMYSILTAHQKSKSTTPIKLLYSARHEEDILYKGALLNMDPVIITLTQETSPDWKGLKGRINKELIESTLDGLKSPLCYICGMSPFVDAASSLLVELGIPVEDILTERFG